ncbi:MAG: THUMP domain-containing class I SAM-dependent RNA methyltransferase, partial [Prolixibacteraceae bacterium]
MKNYNLTAKTFAGLEQVLAQEIEQTGGKNIRQGNRAVYFEGDLKLIYKSNYFLRTALRILREVKVFHFKNIDQFYLRCKQVDWLQHMSVDQSFIINSSVFRSDEFRNSMFASLKVKDAIADYFREKAGKRPNVDTQNPEIHINVHIHQNTCTLSLDSSGESLHKRGYRIKQGQAPLNEVLAAGMILLTGWKGESDFVDPMCGSGTLPVEAAMIAQNIPAGKFRKNFAFFNWNNYNDELFEEIKSETEKKSFTNKIFASDISAENVLNAKTNARRALVYNKIYFQISDIKDLELDVNNAVIVINPPYGERLKSQNLDELYSIIGERLKHQFSGNSAWILSSSAGSLKYIGLKPQKKLE